MRKLSAKAKNSLILSDIHYPHCDVEKIVEILNKENPDLVVLLGDIIVEKENDYKKFLKELNYKRKIIYIRGDEDVINGDTDILFLNVKNRNYILLHGNQYFNERAEYRFAKILKKINRNLPPLLFCLSFKILLRTTDYLILGHSHALVKFDNIKCANAGTLSDNHNIYMDKGYIKIDNNVELIKI
ncbi:metallophosphoesterase family protein [Acidianus brierleyi]|uniref:Metallophosphoesterase n=1 Tax=Acidianus brierleyi TaxID=41673 RepID=A0A2U9IIV1_9CREN|nr:metallophosphoesterase family protein [Acidianus brierleyi]AWR95906.1 metallophosphoesterase [Acidianus brierleyi]